MIEVLTIALVTIMLQYIIYHINMLYILNLHNATCQIYFNNKKVYKESCTKEVF